jgi:hypothetical protein
VTSINTIKIPFSSYTEKDEEGEEEEKKKKRRDEENLRRAKRGRQEDE